MALFVGLLSGCATRCLASLRTCVSRVLGVLLEGGELASPVGLHLIEPCLERKEGLGAQLVEVDTRIRLHPLLVHHATGSQDTQMLAHRWATRSTRGGQLASTAWTVTEQLDHLSSGRISQGVERRIQISNHWVI